jgi:hypothetical protein
MSHTTTLLKHLRTALQRKTNYPLGTLVYYGPDDQTPTKIVAVVLPAPDINPILEKWDGDGIATDPQTAAQIGLFFQKHQVQEVVMTGGIVGCPHEEGVDYPLGEDCPYCPFWAKS